MAWNKNTPQGTDKISQTAQPIRNNWAYIETNVDADHRFVTGGTDGHHKFVQLPSNGVSTPEVIALGACFQARPNSVPATGSSPVWRTSTGSWGMCYGKWIGQVACGVGVNFLFDFTGQPALGGTAYAIRNGSNTRGATASFEWDGATLKVINNQSSGSGQTYTLQPGANHLDLNTTEANTFKVWLIGIPINFTY